MFPKDYVKFVDVFCGSAFLFLNLEDKNFRRKKHQLNDNDPKWINALWVLKEDKDSLLKFLEVHRNLFRWQYYGMLKKDINNSSMTIKSNAELLAKHIFLNRCSYQNSFKFSSTGIFLGTFEKTQRCPELLDKESLDIMNERLKDVELSCLDFESVMNDSQQGDFLYIHAPKISLNYRDENRFLKQDKVRLEKSLDDLHKRGIKFLMVLEKEDYQTKFLRKDSESEMFIYNYVN